MRAITLPTFGEPDVLTLADVIEPPVGPNDVRIDVVGAGINGADVSQRRGSYPPPAGAPLWPGLEVSGTISALGDEVSEWQLGDEVCALLPGGGYAERAVVDAGLVLPVPSGVSLLDAAALPEVAATVWSNVFMSAQLRPTESFLAHGGSSGIGAMAIQIARALGSRVFATAGSAEKVAFIDALGATGINYRQDDFVEVTGHELGGQGVDVILDMVGGDYLARDIRALAVGGRIMVIANQSGEVSSFNVGSLMMKRGRIWATTLRARPLAERVAIVAAVRESVWPLVEQGLVRPTVDSVFAPDDAADAHRRMESSAHMGKILLSFA
ncbi:NAD(P)H-quinone oxidoreductase [Agreia sp. COWG]|uniref:NAD(P)H-quinone oxidoreductase n=1 Tax=Agreia sp. COWG TaxID=2773266 RepID=UPI001927D915|nr:NAD(P)H-quinone oxidoreductase [Agreia sp. COWG]CAD6009308.1 Putative NAD(P)H quinone oxidoreductase, PIG3 family [Agreia sp. COWG]